MTAVVSTTVARGRARRRTGTSSVWELLPRLERLEPLGEVRLDRPVRRLSGAVLELPGIGLQVVELLLAGPQLDVLVPLRAHTPVGRHRRRVARVSIADVVDQEALGVVGPRGHAPALQERREAVAVLLASRRGAGELGHGLGDVHVAGDPAHGARPTPRVPDQERRADALLVLAALRCESVPAVAVAVV